MNVTLSRTIPWKLTGADQVWVASLYRGVTVHHPDRYCPAKADAKRQLGTKSGYPLTVLQAQVHVHGNWCPTCWRWAR